jgi:hypothetical protein
MLTFLAPYRRAVLLSLAFGCLAIAGTVAIPLLIGEAVDAIRDGRREDLLSRGSRCRCRDG